MSTDRPIEVLHVYKDYWPVVGGIENLVRRLAIGINQDPAFHAEVLVTGPGRRTVRESIDGVVVTKAGRLATLASTPLSLSLFAELARRKPDVVHLHFPYPIGELAFLAARSRSRLVISYHSDIVRQRRLLQVYRPFLRRVLARADAITVASPGYVAGSPYLPAFREKIRVLHYGIDLDLFALTDERRAAAARIRAELPGPITLFVGLLRYYKGLEVLIPSMACVPGTLVLVGAGREETAVRALAASQPHADRIVFRGRLSDEDLIAHYHAADVLVLPSTVRAEALGVVLLEAMACGLPLVTTELGTGTSYVNVAGETGLVVPPADRAALARALTEILSDPDLRRRYGDAARHRVEREFREETMIENTKSLYREVLQPR